MTPPAESRRGRPRDATKDEAIIEAAAQLFLERGYEAASIDAVAAAAGVAKATIYARYADKDALFSQVMYRYCVGSVDPARFESAPEREPAQVLAGVAEAFLDRLLEPENVAVFKVLIAEADRASRAAELFFENSVLRLNQMLAAWLQAEAERGRLAVRDPVSAAWQFLGAVKGQAHLRAIIGLPPMDPTELKAHIDACVEDFLQAHRP